MKTPEEMLSAVKAYYEPLYRVRLSKNLSAEKVQELYQNMKKLGSTLGLYYEARPAMAERLMRSRSVQDGALGT